MLHAETGQDQAAAHSENGAVENPPIFLTGTP